MSTRDRLTAEQEMELSERIQAGDADAREEMILKNRRLVTQVAMRFLEPGVALKDLQQEGMLGLIRAAEDFSYVHGVPFSVYAGYWIRHSIKMWMSRFSGQIAVRKAVWDAARKVRKLTKLGDDYDEAAAKAGLDANMMELVRKAEKVRSIRPNTEFDAEDRRSHPSLDSEQIEIIEILYEVISRLDKVERWVFVHAHGLLGKKQMSCREMGECLTHTKRTNAKHYTRAGVHTILKRAKAKVTSDPRIASILTDK